MRGSNRSSPPSFDETVDRGDSNPGFGVVQAGLEGGSDIATARRRQRRDARAAHVDTRMSDRAAQRFDDPLVCQGLDKLEERFRRAFSFPANELLP